MDFRVQLDVFRGPLDLLLFLVRKHELDVRDLPIALIADQYLAHLEILQQLDVDEVGDFLELASTLIEIKSQLVLPRGAEHAESRSPTCSSPACTSQPSSACFWPCSSSRGTTAYGQNRPTCTARSGSCRARILIRARISWQAMSIRIGTWSPASGRLLAASGR